MNFILTIALFIPSLLLAQTPFVFTIPDDIEHNGVEIDSIWNFKVGDDLAWSDPKFDDYGWDKINLSGSDLTDNENIPEDQAVVWFRIRLKTNSPFHSRVHLYVFQSGASEIYLDGNLVHRLGKVSANPDSLVYFNPSTNMLPILLNQNKEHLLAIRFANKPAKYPLYAPYNQKSWLRVYASARIYDFDHPITQTRLIEYGKDSVVVGVAGTLSVLFFVLFIFFPRQKLNLYFSISVFFLAIQMLLEMAIFWNTHNDYAFLLAVCRSVLSGLYALFGLYCIYLIFNRKPRKFFLLILITGILIQPLGFVYAPGTLSALLGALVLADGIRLGIKNIRVIKGAEIIVVLWSLSALFWVLLTLSDFGVVSLTVLDSYTSFAQLLVPLSIAIYFGYSVGLTNQSLRENLVEVEKLSAEKQLILSNQKQELEKEVKSRTTELNESLEDLKATQSQLIHSEKMASLGELTAGIAHEIQNPLNFVNNFSDLSEELIEELEAEIDAGNTTDVKELTKDLKDNLSKIHNHGERASSIVKGMLQHSRSGTGEKELTDLNAMADEYLRLAYHGLRAKDKSFNADFKLELDESLPKVNVVPQDIGRVLLNLINNAFFAVREAEQPLVKVSTKTFPLEEGEKKGVELVVSDNGPGISEGIKDKIFQPFFTTKATGEGTGLGLSMSYDIITKGHGGKIEVESEPGKGTKFIIELPDQPESNLNR